MKVAPRPKNRIEFQQKPIGDIRFCVATLQDNNGPLQCYDKTSEVALVLLDIQKADSVSYQPGMCVVPQPNEI